MDTLFAFPLLFVAFVPSRTRRAVVLLVLGLATSAAINLPWLAERLKITEISEVSILQVFSNPGVMVIVNLISGGVIVWSLAQLLLGGSPQQLVDQLKVFEEAGVQRFMLEHNDLDDVNTLELLASEILPQFE